MSILSDRPALAATGFELGDTAGRWAVAPVVCLSVGLLAAGNGGYFAPAWGWSAAALLWAAGLMLLVGEPARLRVVEWTALGAFTGLAVWMVGSQLWEGAATQPMQEAERTLVYVAGMAACLLLTRRGALRPLLTGLLLAVVAASLYGLAGRVVPGSWLAGGSVDTGRMAQPLGYWNGLGIFAAMGLLVAFGLAAHAGPRALRALAAASLPPLLCTMYFTYSRGAWAALIIGLLAALACDRRRGFLLLTVLITAVPAAATVGVAATSSGLTHAGSPMGLAARQGHRLGAVVLAAVLLEIVAALALHRINRSWRPSKVATRVGYVLSGALVLALVAGSLVVVGSPVTIVKRLYDGFNGQASGGFTAKNGQVGKDLNLRLFSLSGNSRAELWRIAWADARRHPLLGSGAGSYERVYLARRQNGLKVTDAHSLYLETLAELGPVGLALLLIGLGAPLVAGVRARSHPLVPVAMGGYVAFLAHAGVDWDWELPAVTLAAIVLSVALMRGGQLDDARPLGRRVRIASAVAVGALLVLSLIGLRGNLALSDSQAAAARGDWSAARRDAQTAVDWAPWSSDSWVALGDARFGSRSSGGLAAYRHALRLDDGDWTTWFAVARGARGDVAAAALRRAEALNPRGKQIRLYAALRRSQSAS